MTFAEIREWLIVHLRDGHGCETLEFPVDGSLAFTPHSLADLKAAHDLLHVFMDAEATAQQTEGVPATERESP